MKSQPNLRRNHFAATQRGSFLLEALVSVLIVAFGLLGLIGLQARSIQNVDDAQYRGEAAYLANGALGQMWTSQIKNAADMTAFIANYDSSKKGAGWTELSAMVNQRLPGASAVATNPVVTITALGTTPNSANVLIQVFWQPPGDTLPHKYEVAATVGMN